MAWSVYIGYRRDGNAHAGIRTTGAATQHIVIMGDDVGWANIGVYNQGIMAGRTPNLDKLAAVRGRAAPAGCDHPARTRWEQMPTSLREMYVAGPVIHFRLSLYLSRHLLPLQ
jgi:hypothetical protein